MASLAGRSLVSSYKELLKLNNATLNSGVSASLQTVEDGFAGATALQLSSAGLASTGTLATTGDFSVNTNKFNVTASSGNTAVAGTLASVGDFSVNTNKFTVAAASGNTSVAGTLNVTGTSTLAAVGGTTGSFSQTLASTGDFSVNTNKFNVTAASGNTSVAGTLSVTSSAALSSSLTVTGVTNLSSTLGVAGNLAINTDKFNVTASNGNTSVAGTLTVTGPGVTAYFDSTGAIRLPQGIDGQRPAGQAGMLRFNTGSQSFEGHNGTLWGAIGGSGSGGSSQYVRETFTATAGQTTFTVTGGYTPERIDVFQNGVKLVNGSGNDVTVTSGTNIVLATGAAAGDIIDVVGLASGNFAGPATAKRQNFTATANQTVFTVTGGYTPGQLDVFQNGTKLLNAVDVDVSNGSTFTLTTGANAGDSVEVVGFTAADTISGTLKFQDGTAAAPSITSFNDTNTGIFFPAADTIAFAEGGAEAMRIDSSGRVGIGTSPSTKLHTQGGRVRIDANSENFALQLNNSTTGNGCFLGSAGADTFVISSSGGAERLRIDSSGNVGVGTTSPVKSLHILNPTAAVGSAQLELEGQTNGYGAGINFSARTSNGGTLVAMAKITADGEDAWNTTGTTQDAGLRFSTTQNGTLAERLRIDSSGNLLVGTTTARGKQTLNGDFYFGGTTSGDYNLYNYENGSIRIGTNNTERLRIDSSGRVLIARSTADLGTVGYRFDTTGEMYASINLATNSAITYGAYSTSASAYRFYVGMAGTVFATNTTISAISDIRYKENIRDLNVGLESIMALRPRVFDWKDGKGKNIKNDRGFIAQEFEQVFPDLIDEWKDDAPQGEEPYKSVRQDLIPVLVKAIQELKSKNDILEAKVAALEAA